MMSFEAEMLGRAATRTRQRIRNDQERVPVRIKPLLAHIHDHLFDPDLNAETLKRACDVRDNSRATLFHAAVGMPPYRYIKDCRLETAAQLLQDTELQIWKVAALVGYPSPTTFSRAFQRSHGKSPRRYRDEAPPPPNQDDKPVAPQEGPSPHDEANNERAAATRVWAAMAERPWEEQRRVVRAQRSFCTTALFDLLRTKSRELGREDRQHGLHLAELALESIDPGDPLNTAGADLANHKARAWAWLGNSRRLVLDLRGAEKAFAFAELYLPDEEAAPLIKAEIFDLKAALRWYQRRFTDALDLENQAIPLYRQFGQPNQIARALILRGVIQQYADEPNAGLSDLQEAIDLAGENDLYAKYAAYQNMASCCLDAGFLQRAVQLFPAARSICKRLNNEWLTVFLSWLEGKVALELQELDRAIKILSSVRNDALRLHYPEHAAAVTLDLAFALILQGKVSKATTLTLEVIPLFEALQVHREAAVASSILKNAVRSKALQVSALYAARLSLKRIQQDPSIQLDNPRAIR